MDAVTLRWVLIVIGLVIIGLIFVFGNPEKKKSPRASRRASQRGRKAGQESESKRREPTMGAGDGSAESDTADSSGPESGGQGELAIGNEAEPKPEPAKPSGPPPDRILTLYLLARDNRMITGAELLEGAVKTGMDFGEMNIFHRTMEGDRRPIFSLANAAKPGHFDRSTWHEFETGALVLFLTLPNPMRALDAWDTMLATARRMAEVLHAELQDDEHHLFSRQREAQIREEMRDYDRKRTVTRG